MKKLTALLLVLAMLVTLAACTKKDEKKEPKDSTAPIETKAPAQLIDAPVLNINEIYGLSPEGQKATLANTLSLTDEDKAAVKEGNYKVAICMHQMDNDVNVMKVNTIKKILGDLGVEIIAVTDGQSSVEQMTTNLETVIAMKPNAIISIAYDVNAMVGIFEKSARRRHQAGILRMRPDRLCLRTGLLCTGLHRLLWLRSLRRGIHGLPPELRRNSRHGLL